MPAIIVTGLGFGDEGKGLVVDYLARQHKASGVVRYNGGAQAAHNVVLPDGLHHNFHQFGAGTLSGVPTYLSEYMLVNPHALFSEWEELGDEWAWPSGLMNVHEDALITTPFHVAANRIRSRANDHGTCGMGIGETVTAAHAGVYLRVHELSKPGLRKRLKFLQDYLRQEISPFVTDWNDQEVQKLVNPQQIIDAMEIYRIFCKAVPLYNELPIKPEETWIFEGAQGVLLDQRVGFHPHTTWSCTTNENAQKILLPFSDIEVKRIGVMRSYMTRHGAGPFPTENQLLTDQWPDEHNDDRGFQGQWRVGWTDLVLMRYALEACEVDELAVTHLDRLYNAAGFVPWNICTEYDVNITSPEPHWHREKWLQEREWTLELLKKAKPNYSPYSSMTNLGLLTHIEHDLGKPVTIESYGPTYRDVETAVYA